MLNTHYKDLSEENKQFAVHRIAAKTLFTTKIVQKVLQRYNPLMEIQQNRIVINRNSYQKLIREIRKEHLLAK
ncbi:hypothetical protein J8L88_02385 [Aquimarina sp. MMG015]|uniref:hypothetical protein n=1 Tax=Aquimarina TaxID=290174 RepID=UPI000417811B|nr:MULTISPECIES: hypothetical protein [Aquimarina]AXT57049.1 hypothetical protein D1815_15330 [Aquimarina sp. AD1]MBQ4801683.1 hypothetical protein [Aquimarina sp. MMG015]RKN26357.1 hypothetical protein D7035_09400 [Aquimarina sp. AD1]